MSPNGSFDELMARLRAGDADAARQVHARFAGRLIGLARPRLAGLLRAKLDAEDVVQSVFKSFFRRQGDGQFTLRDWNSLWGLLVVITLRKCGRHLQHFRGPYHDVRREAAAPPSAGDSGSGWQPADPEPTPAEAAVLAETVERLLSGFDERDREIVELSLQGWTVAEISDRVGRSQRTVQLIRQRLRRRLERLRDEDG